VTCSGKWKVVVTVPDTGSREGNKTVVGSVCGTTSAVMTDESGSAASDSG